MNEKNDKNYVSIKRAHGMDFCNFYGNFFFKYLLSMHNGGAYSNFCN